MSSNRRPLRFFEGPGAGHHRWGLAVVVAVEEFYADQREDSRGWVGRTKVRIRQGFPLIGYKHLSDLEMYHLMRAVLRAVRGDDWDE